MSEPIHVEERRPLSVVLLAPLGALSVVDASAVIALLSSELKTRTDLKVVALEAERANDCAGALHCLIERTGARPPLFLVLSAVRSKVGGDRISATLVDVAEDAVLLRPEWTEIPDAAALERFVARLINVELKPMFESRGAWEPYGSLSIHGLPAGTQISVDGVMRGVAGEEDAELVGLSPGERSILLEHAAIEPVSATVQIARGERAALHPAIAAKRSDASAFRAAVSWTGAGVAAIGAGMVVYAVAADRPQVLCLTGALDRSRCASGGAFPRSNDGGRGAPELDVTRGGGVALAPLGYSILATGALWALGAWLFGDERDPPWIALAAGVGAGALSFTLSTALEGDVR